MTDTQALIARLEAATGPCRELDAAIWRMTRADEYRNWEWSQRAMLDRNWDEQRRQITLKARAKSAAPTYTASIDAALTLVPEGCVWKVMTDYGGLNRASISDIPRFIVSADAESPALAIVIAALRAIETRQQPHN